MINKVRLGGAVFLRSDLEHLLKVAIAYRALSQAIFEAGRAESGNIQQFKKPDSYIAVYTADSTADTASYIDFQLSDFLQYNTFATLEECLKNEQ